MSKRGPLELSPTAVYLGAVVRQLEQERDQWRDEAQQAQARSARLVEAARAVVDSAYWRNPLRPDLYYASKPAVDALQAAIAEHEASVGREGKHEGTQDN